VLKTLAPMPSSSLPPCTTAHSPSPGQPRERVAVQAIHGPFVHRERTEGLVEPDRRFVPVEHGPLQAATAALHGELRQRGQEGLAVPVAAKLGQDEEVLEIDGRLCQKRRVSGEEERVSDRLVRLLGNQRFAVWPLAKQMLTQARLIEVDPVRKSL